METLRLFMLVVAALVAAASAFQIPHVPTMHRSSALFASQTFYPDGKLYQDLDDAGNPLKTYVYSRKGELIQTLDKDGNPDTEFFRKFGHLKGAKVKTVSETLQEFYTDYGMPIFPAFRNIVTEILVSTHLSVVTAMFAFDPVFSFGFKGLWAEFMSAYPVPEHREKMYPAVLKALGMTVSSVEEDERKIMAFLEGKSGSDVLAVMKGEKEDATLGPIFKTIRENKFFWYSRPFGAGLFKMMMAVGVELTEDNVKQWVAALKVDDNLPLQDLKIYQDSVARLKDAEKMYKEIEIREKKAMAKRLEDKADRAIKAAEEKARKAEEAAASQ